MQSVRRAYLLQALGFRVSGGRINRWILDADA